MTITKTYSWAGLLALLGLLALPPFPAKAATFLIFTDGAPTNVTDGGGDVINVSHGNLGETFTVSSPLVITALGAYTGQYNTGTSTTYVEGSPVRTFDPSAPGTTPPTSPPASTISPWELWWGPR